MSYLSKLIHTTILLCYFQAEFDNTNFINYYRTVKEYSVPFTDPNSPVYRAGLRLVSIETAVVSCPYQEKWLKDGKKGKRTAYIYTAPTTNCVCYPPCVFERNQLYQAPGGRPCHLKSQSTHPIHRS